MPKQKLSAQMRELFGALQFHDIFVKMAERIEALEKQQEFLTRYGITVEVETVETSQEILALRQRVKELEADAALGKLVREMPKHTALMKTLTSYWTYWTHDSNNLRKWTMADHPWCNDDPAKALRAIQEVCKP